MTPKVKIEKVIESVTIDRLAVTGSVDSDTINERGSNYASLTIRFIPDVLEEYLTVPKVYVDRLVIRDVSEPKPIIFNNIRLVLLSVEGDMSDHDSMMYTYHIIESEKKKKPNKDFDDYSKRFCM